MKPAKYLLPQRKQNHYVWTHLEARKSAVGGQGLFAKQEIPFGVFIPYLGVAIPDALVKKYYEEIVGATTLRWKYLASRDRDTAYTDGYPGFQMHKGFGCNGLSAAALMNEPPPGLTPNVMFYDQYLLTVRKIRKGEEIFGCYGLTYYPEFKQSKACKKPIMHKLMKGLDKPIPIKTLLRAADIQEPVLRTEEQMQWWFELK
jgi:hypothetical protein